MCVHVCACVCVCVKGKVVCAFVGEALEEITNMVVAGVAPLLHHLQRIMRAHTHTHSYTYTLVCTRLCAKDFEVIPAVRSLTKQLVKTHIFVFTPSNIHMLYTHRRMLLRALRSALPCAA